MTVKRVVTPERFISSSLTDTKPTDGATSVRPGATFYNATGRLFITPDGTNWAEKLDPTWTFGTPTLMANNNSRAFWFKSGTSPYYQKSTTSWLAELYGGAQTGDDWAGVFIPVNEMPTNDFTAAMWSYFMSASDSFGCNVVIWLHDPTDFDKRVEVTQRQQHAGLEKAAGWNAHELDTAVTQFFYYGEGVSGTDNIVAAGTDYTWAQYQTDALFSTWTIYRISLEFGWQQTGTFGTAWVADIKLNGQLIPLYPDIQRFKKTASKQKTLNAATGYDAGDVMSEATSNGTDWDFVFGGTGKIVQATIVSETNSLTADVDLYLYSSPPTCELDDHALNDGPVVGDAPFFIGVVGFASMTSPGGISYAVATGLSLAFDTTTIYGVAVQTSSEDFSSGTTLDITLTAELEA